MDKIMNLSPISFIIQQEEKYQDVIDYNPEYEAANNLVQCSQEWDLFRGSQLISAEPVYDNFSLCHSAFLLIPFYIARWHLAIRDSTRTFHLKPALVYITAFCDQMRYLKVCTTDTPIVEKTRNEIISEMDTTNNNNNKTYVTELLRKSFQECSDMREVVNKELDECLMDPTRAGELQDINIANDSQLVFSPLTNHQQADITEDLEDLAASIGNKREDDIEEQLARSEQSDFRAACDLLGDFVNDEEQNIVVDDPLTFEPQDVGEFNALRDKVREMFKDLPADERLIFAKSFLEKATDNLPSYMIKDISDSLKH